MGAVYDDLPDHEGYAVEHRGLHTAACSCGWRDDDTNTDHESAINRWEQRHAAGLLERAIPREVTDLVDDTRRALAHLARTRPKAAGIVLDQLDRAIVRLRGVARDVDRATPTVAQRLHGLGAARPRSPWIDR